MLGKLIARKADCFDVETSYLLHGYMGLSLKIYAPLYRQIIPSYIYGISGCPVHTRFALWDSEVP